MSITRAIELWKLGFPVKKSKDPLFSKLVNTEAECFLQLPNYPLSAIFACHFGRAPGLSHILISVNESGEVYIIDTKRRTKEIVTSLHKNAIFDFTWLASEPAIVTVSGDSSAKVWYLEKDSWSAVTRGHEWSIKCVTNKLDDPHVFATGGRDGYLIQWDLRIKDPTSLIVKPDQFITQPFFTRARSSKRRHDFSNSITGIVYQEDHNLISCTAVDGLIKVWDMRRTYTANRKLQTPKAILKHPVPSGSFTNLVVSPCQTKLYANGIDGNIYCFNVGVLSEVPMATYTGPPRCTFYTKNSVSPDGQYLSVGSIDKNVYLWNVDSPRPIVKLEGHEAEVTSVDWRPYGEPTLATCSDDATCRLWRVEPSKHPDVTGETDKGESERLRGHAIEMNRDGVFKERKRFFSCHLKQHRAALKKATENDENVDLSNIPHHLQLTPVKGVPCLTSNLPNLVIDGVSPHHHVCPRVHSASRKDADWLTKFRQTSSTPPPAAMNNGAVTSASRGKRSSTRKPSFTVKRKLKSRSNLMNYFATQKDSRCTSPSLEDPPLVAECRDTPRLTAMDI